MNANELTSIQVRAFLSGTQRVVFEVASESRAVMTGYGGHW